MSADTDDVGLIYHVICNDEGVCVHVISYPSTDLDRMSN